MFMWQEIFAQRIDSLNCRGAMGTIEQHPEDTTGSDERLFVRVYTGTHVYSISCNKNYLGCTVHTRAPLPGEQHTRGNDLADGPNTRGTWVRILTDIVAYELIPLHVEPVQCLSFPFNGLPDSTYTDSPVDLQLGDEIGSNERNSPPFP